GSRTASIASISAESPSHAARIPIATLPPLLFGRLPGDGWKKTNPKRQRGLPRWRFGLVRKPEAPARQHPSLALRAGKKVVAYTNSGLGTPARRCGGRPVGSLMVVVERSSPRWWYSVAKIAEKVPGRFAACSPGGLAAPTAWPALIPPPAMKAQ